MSLGNTERTSTFKSRHQWLRSAGCYLLAALLFFLTGAVQSQAAHEGSFVYKDFSTPEYCGTACHIDIYQQLRQAMMSQAYVHHWDEIEYFELAIPHAEKDPKVAEIKKSCNICHTPIAFMAGEVGRRVSPCYQVFDLDSEDSYLRVVAFVIPPKLIIVIGNV